MKSRKIFKEVLREFENDQGLLNLLEDIQKIVTENNQQMNIGETPYVDSGEDFRRWLSKNHKDKKEIWSIFY
jgi:hypothetical protein